MPVLAGDNGTTGRLDGIPEREDGAPTEAPMRICMLLTDTYPPDPRVRKEATALQDGGHEVELLCRGEPAVDTVDGIDVHRVPDSAWDGLGGLFRGLVNRTTGVHPTWHRALREELATGVDAIHVHDLPAAKTALRAADEVPVVVDLHENYPQAKRQWRKDADVGDVLTSPAELSDRLLRPARRWDRRLRDVLERADHVLATVPEARTAYVDRGADPEAVTVVSNTVDLAWFDAALERHAVPETDGFTLTYVGTLSGVHRGLETAVRAMPGLLDAVPDARLRIVGDGPMRAPLEARVADLGIEEAVAFVGWVDADAMPAQMAAADVGLVPHRSNPHTNTTVPHKLFQYMAAGLPVVATDTDRVAHVVRDADAGRVVAPETPDALAEAAAGLAAGGRRETLGRNAREAVESTYNWQRDADRLREAYDTLAPASAPRAARRRGQ